MKNILRVLVVMGKLLAVIMWVSVVSVEWS